jgi:GAF domain-containing protein
MSPDDLRRLHLLDVNNQPDLSTVLQLAFGSVDAAHLFIGILDDQQDRLYFAGNYGRVDAARTRRASPLSHALATVVRETRAPLVIDDAPADARVADHPYVRQCGYQAYIGVPVLGPTGEVIGAVSAGALEPHRWTLAEMRAMRNAGLLVSNLIMMRAMSRIICDFAITHPMLGTGRID